VSREPAAEELAPQEPEVKEDIKEDAQLTHEDLVRVISEVSSLLKSYHDRLPPKGRLDKVKDSANEFAKKIKIILNKVGSSREDIELVMEYFRGISYIRDKSSFKFFKANYQTGDLGKRNMGKLVSIMNEAIVKANSIETLIKGLKPGDKTSISLEPRSVQVETKPSIKDRKRKLTQVLETGKPPSPEKEMVSSEKDKDEIAKLIEEGDKEGNKLNREEDIYDTGRELTPEQVKIIEESRKKVLKPKETKSTLSDKKTETVADKADINDLASKLEYYLGKFIHYNKYYESTDKIPTEDRVMRGMISLDELIDVCKKIYESNGDEVISGLLSKLEGIADTQDFIKFRAELRKEDFKLLNKYRDHLLGNYKINMIEPF